MFRVIAYHGKGNKEVRKDLALLYEGLRDFSDARVIRHLYFFQSLRNKNEITFLMVIQYIDNNDAVNKLHVNDKDINYWFYIRKNKEIENVHGGAL